MVEESRPDPSELLQRMKKRSRGHLKIFFGYAAGVGKTYTMLAAAHSAKKAGIDVVVGYVEPHQRPDTLAMLKGLEEIPPLLLEQRGLQLREFDLDRAIERNPCLILVDELAHTNAEGCRHKKRYQDIEELLRAGIDVYTTINVQHIESLNNIVEGFTGVTVRERIPDRIFDSADQVEIVDIEPDDLIERLHEGKIYKQEHAKRALDHFFKRNNLVSLREIALRQTADHVNRVAQKERCSSTETAPATEEHILICLSSASSNTRVIRTAARLADAFRGTFTAVFVETPAFADISEKQMGLLRQNLKLAEQLGARIATVYGDNIAYQIAEYSRVSGVTKIVLGRSNSKRYFFSKPALVEQLADLAPDLDIYIIPDNQPSEPIKTKWEYFEPSQLGINLFKSFGILFATTALAFVLQHFSFMEENILTIYILGVLCIAIVTNHRVYSIGFSFLAVLIFNYFFTEPLYTLQMYNKGYPFAFAITLVVALMASTLTTKTANQAKQLAGHAHRTEILLETSQKLQKSHSKKEIIQAAGNQIHHLLEANVLVYPVEEGVLGEPILFSHQPDIDITPFVTQAEKGVAQWVYKNNLNAGATTNTLPASKCLYLAVRNSNMVFAVVAVEPPHHNQLETFDRSLLLAMLNEFAFALEKEELQQTKNKVALQAEQEKLQANLLRAISHDFRTPLTSIYGNAEILMESGEKIPTLQKKQMCADICDDSIWLLNLMENLLSVTRLENSGADIPTDAEVVQEIIQEALRHVARKTEDYTVRLDIPDDMLMAQMDPRLVTQVLINLIDNAVKYTPAGTEIVISAYKQGQQAVIKVTDNGPGIPIEEQPKIFDMFYVLNNPGHDGRRGLGLGLALCKSIITALGGDFTVAGNQPHGSIFTFTLPLPVEKPSG